MGTRISKDRGEQGQNPPLPDSGLTAEVALAKFMVAARNGNTMPAANSPEGRILILEREILLLKQEGTQLHSENARLAAENKALLYESQHDELTGALNTKGLQLFIQEDARLHPDGSRGIIYFDLKSFRVVNNKYGHGVANNVLATIGESFSRESDTLARVHSAGDEFALFTDTTNRSNDPDRTVEMILADQVHYLSDSLRRIVLDSHTILSDIYPGSVAYFGAVPYDHSLKFEANIEAADLAMTANKAFEKSLEQ